ncbi:MAG: CPBP family intramembrane glutamic endopeptidase [Treponemataceae bacterium]
MSIFLSLLGLSYLFHLAYKKPSAFSTPSITLLIIITTIILASFEELIYRDFLPNAFMTIVLLKNKLIFFVIETFCCLLFSFAHLYAGLPTVLYAFLSGILLRVLAKKTSIWYAIIVHSCYNLLVLFINVKLSFPHVA